MKTDEATHAPLEAIDFEDLLTDLDAILDAWFLGEVTPALEEACRARQVPNVEAA